MAEFVTIAHIDDLKLGECKVVEAKARTLALYNVNGTYYATDNTCLHRGGPLGEGDLDDKMITCPWHGWQYDVTTGENTSDPNSKVETIEVKVEGDNVQVKI